MQFEAMAPSHRPLPISSQAFEYLVGITSEIVAYRHHRRVHETDACTVSEGGEVKKEHHLEEYAALELHESVVGYGIGEIGLQMLPDEEQVVVFEIAERTKLEHYQNRHNLTVREGCLAIATRLMFNFISDWNSDIKVQKISQITNFLCDFLIPNWGKKKNCVSKVF